MYPGTKVDNSCLIVPLLNQEVVCNKLVVVLLLRNNLGLTERHQCTFTIYLFVKYQEVITLLHEYQCKICLNLYLLTFLCKAPLCIYYIMCVCFGPQIAYYQIKALSFGKYINVSLKYYCEQLKLLTVNQIALFRDTLTRHAPTKEVILQIQCCVDQW